MKTILIIDDEQSLRGNLAEILLLEGYDTLEAEDGVTGLAQVREHLPDLIICDIAMPRLDGLELVRQVRGDARTAAIPIVLLTAKAEKTSTNAGLALGANRYLVKPFLVNDVLTIIQELLETA